MKSNVSQISLGVFEQGAGHRLIQNIRPDVIRKRLGLKIRGDHSDVAIVTKQEVFKG
jgi:hypothetical protein